MNLAKFDALRRDEVASIGEIEHAPVGGIWVGLGDLEKGEVGRVWGWEGQFINGRHDACVGNGPF